MRVPSKAMSLTRIDSWKYFFSPDEDVSLAEEALIVLDVYEPVTSDICALTTIKNFRADSLNEFVCQSEWVVISRKKLLEPRFQQGYLTKTDTLTNLCRSLAENGVNRRRLEVIAKPPKCHCNELSTKSEKPVRTSLFRVALNGFKSFWKGLYCNLCGIFKAGICIPKPYYKTPFEYLSTTDMYLCK